jgi:hypothetical protein
MQQSRERQGKGRSGSPRYTAWHGTGRDRLAAGKRVEEEPGRVGRWEGKSQSQARINQEAKGRGQGRTLLVGAS